MKTKLVNGVRVVMGAQEAEQFERTRPPAPQKPKKTYIEVLTDALIAKGVITDEDLQEAKK